MTQTDILLITPPFIQINSPYPATTMLKAFLESKGFTAEQCDLSLLTMLELLSEKNLKACFAKIPTKNLSKNTHNFLKNKNLYLQNIDRVIKFLQGNFFEFENHILNNKLPKGNRYHLQKHSLSTFKDNNSLKAQFLASIFVEEIADFLTENIDSRFGFSRYAEKIILQNVSFQKIFKTTLKDTFITHLMLKILDQEIKDKKPKSIGFSIPFPGNFILALKAAFFVKQHYPEIKVIFGGGFINTELRQLSEKQLFENADFVCLDDGELPLLQIMKHLDDENVPLKRTFIRKDDKVLFMDDCPETDFHHSSLPVQNYAGLPLQKYFSMVETSNPMHNLWSHGKWIKMMLSHGCYWHQCAFCDTSLDYIKRYSTADSEQLCDRMEALTQQTRWSDFHFVDEAASPAVLRKLAETILKRNLKIRWWTNIRFEKAFTAELCQLLAKSGCIAVSGGIEVASDRLLQKMKKGVSIAQVAESCFHFQQAKIMVHGYLMYGFPTQTAQETIDSLEVVRQLFANKLLQSAFWHRFTMTVHSPVGINPEKFNVKRINLPPQHFLQNALEHIDKKGCKHELYALGLRKAIYNYIHQNGFDFPLQTWFDFSVPKTKMPKLWTIRNSEIVFS